MIYLAAVRSMTYQKNEDRVRGDLTPCVVCGKGIDTSTGRPKFVRLHNGGSSIVTADEADALNAAGHESSDLYWFPIGADCLRRHPELAAYAR